MDCVGIPYVTKARLKLRSITGTHSLCRTSYPKQFPRHIILAYRCATFGTPSLHVELHSVETVRVPNFTIVHEESRLDGSGIFLSARRTACGHSWSGRARSLVDKAFRQGVVSERYHADASPFTRYQLVCTMNTYIRCVRTVSLFPMASADIVMLGTAR